MRILHIGNIANNAWYNAKLMSETGAHHCDVICYDYYHVTGTPEWEEGRFANESVDDPFKPSWYQLEPDFERPDWFVQGRMSDCLKYLEFRDRGKRKSAEKQLKKLHHQCRIAKPDVWFHVAEEIRFPSRNSTRFAIHSYRRLFDLARGVVRKGGRLLTGLRRSLTESTPLWMGPQPQFSHPSFPGRYAQLHHSMTREMTTGELSPKIATGHFSSCSRLMGQRRLDRHLESLVEDFAARFPDRRDQLTLEDLAPYRTMAEQWTGVLCQYDIVQGYATDPIIPMICNVPYFAFEHGTLRDKPFEDSPQGRLTALAYSRAEHVFVTNFDCMPSAWKLAGRDRVTFINHPFDEVGIERSAPAGLRAGLKDELEADLLVFFPTRHDWIEGKGHNDKANDRLLRAIGRINRIPGGKRIGVILCDWGNNVEESRQLIDREGFSSHVKWISPKATKPFLDLVGACDIVADQFKLGSFGGIFFKAMAAGTPILTYLDESQFLDVYEEMAPVLNAQHEEEIFQRLEQALAAPEELESIGERGKTWIRNHHAGAETVARQFLQYRKFLQIREEKITFLPGKFAA